MSTALAVGRGLTEIAADAVVASIVLAFSTRKRLMARRRTPAQTRSARSTRAARTGLILTPDKRGHTDLLGDVSAAAAVRGGSPQDPEARP
ncbi:hypothetical protein OG921_26315 [Aldersonia sp. NBC_00410]|uniref:hypothetical protein n=1 Tax=Aldersonia sp. NBC_00410 TaxID=2975954 RepID=UPI002256357A|nr:hypothetical protein [Aldersonia sp. NBC_00410]MCX5046694.1 hypothetical protein [Aldersonia sp. NBC_00410]